MAVRLPIVEWGAWRREGDLLWWEAEMEGARLAFTTRQGGASRAPYDTLNLGLHVGDAEDAVLANRRALTSALGIAPPVLGEQVHGAVTAIVRRAGAGSGWEARETALAATDALVTPEAGLPLAILVADCAPVLLLPPRGALAVAHAGWRGLASGVLEAALGGLSRLSSAPPRACRAVIGPCIRGCCYEVGQEVWSRFPSECLAPGGGTASRRLDLMTAVTHRLRQAGLPPEQIHAVGLCTACHPALFFSHRRATREGLAATGRMALLAVRS
jgi:YfiH family protein